MMFCTVCDLPIDETLSVNYQGSDYCVDCYDIIMDTQDEPAPLFPPLEEPAPQTSPTPNQPFNVDEFLAAYNPLPFKKRAKLILDEEGDFKMAPMQAMDGFKFGCDPEAFIRNPEGKHVSAALLLPGTKSEPFPVEFGAVQVDGMAAEFNIDPASDFETWNRNIREVVRQLEAMLPPGHTLDFSPSVVFDPDTFNTAPDIAKELGCSPDWNAWTGEVNPPPSDPENPFMRCAAGHIHLGWTEGETPDNLQHIMNCNDIVKQLDWYLGGWSTKIDTDPTRRRLYGRAGACRYKSYGVEYRVLSNFWVSSRDRRLAVWNRMQQAISDMRNVFVPDRARKWNDALVDMINTSGEDPHLIAQAYRFPLRTIDTSYSRF